MRCWSTVDKMCANKINHAADLPTGRHTRRATERV